MFLLFDTTTKTDDYRIIHRECASVIEGNHPHMFRLWNSDTSGGKHDLIYLVLKPGQMIVCVADDSSHHDLAKILSSFHTPTP